ncbi:hypothetical protein R3Q06_17655 [Rhodococcus erythropolis]|uniref:hypothetical protein n=1 Tax=Rhodococcus erythropolis TaxID=1833 RepID=UPI0029495ECC|nr:hypothetical protein [Rhodococcus erythropolis]MDV6275325.1 hypothetical protein [Rhodococcus erythropolis]
MTNPNTTPSIPRKKMLRALLVAPVAVGALAGALAAGTGISAAAPTGSAAPDLPGTTQTSPYQWSVQNLTVQTLTNGHLTVSELGGTSSSISFSDTSPAFFGDTKTATQEYGGKALTWDAAVCFKGKMWSSESSKVNTKAAATFTLESDSQGTPFVKSPGGDRSPMREMGVACR